MSKFYDDIDFDNTDFRKHPERYRVGRGEQGVLLVEPYKSEILPNWRFKSVPVAEKSSEKIYEQYAQYKKAGDFVGMDMARKFLQMGYTRARRYANYPGGKKYSKNGEVNERKIDEEKAAAAAFLRKNGSQCGKTKSICS
ncbi:putative cytoplasmic protein [Geomicrobium sp. JCM 19039]|nr:putative cytoplasmic protein [Geomicrobium sp. JCM 19039]